MAGSLLRADPCQDRTPQNFSITEDLPGRLAGEKAQPSLGDTVGVRLSIMAAEKEGAPGISTVHLRWVTPGQAVTPGTRVGASSFGRGKSRGIQTSDYLGPELLSGGSL